MREFEFLLRFALPDRVADPATFVEALGEAGCTDALVGIGRSGMIALEFGREAASAREALMSAVRDVQAAIPGAKLVEASPDVVGLTDIADIMGFSRQYMRRLAYGPGAGFPAPIHQGNPSVWHLAPVLRWFQSTGRDVDADLIDLARLNMHLNLAVGESSTDAGELREARSLLA
jgi:hypothetical protein